MNRVLRAVVTCLLLVALPLQGYAAGTMLFCGAGAGLSVAEHSRDGASHDHGRPAHHHDVAATELDDDGALNLHDAMHGKCSVCSSCCSAAALPSNAIPASAAAPRAAPLPPFEPASPGDGATRLERPPRLNLA